MREILKWWLVFKYRPKVESGEMTVEEAVRAALLDYGAAVKGGGARRTQAD